MRPSAIPPANAAYWSGTTVPFTGASDPNALDARWSGHRAAMLGARSEPIMQPSAFATVLDGRDSLEGPRWHAGRLWLSDFYQHEVLVQDSAGGWRCFACCYDRVSDR